VLVGNTRMNSGAALTGMNRKAGLTLTVVRCHAELLR
jgi:hypothetical protein